MITGRRTALGRWAGAVTAVMLASLLVACPEADKDEVDSDDPCVHDPPLSYDNWGKGFMEKHCNGCHSSIVPPSHRNNAPPGVDFDTYPGVLAFASRIDERAILLNPSPMPPGGGPTEEELSLLYEWLTCSVYPDVERWQQEIGGGSK